MKINVIMPTFNDADTIEETLDSLVCQTYSNWHLSIVNDGSTDNTEKVIKEYIKNNLLEQKITYIYQENSDQLNAIKNALSGVEDNGLIYILHSDDLIYDENVFQKAVDYFKYNNPDALISDYDTIDEKGNYIETIKTKKYKKNDALIALQGLWLGRNLFVDFSFCQAKIYKHEVFDNYLTWNTPFWLNSNMTLLNIENSDFKFFKYRVHGGNYINNEIGLLNVLNGELRTATNILKNYKMPFYKFQYYLFRLLNKFNINYKVIYRKKETNNLHSIIRFIINKRIKPSDLKKYPYYESILNFYKKLKVNRSINITEINDTDLFYGSDVRAFNKLMLDNNLPELYYTLFKEMNKGFNKIITTKNNIEKITTILKFLDIYNFVEIEIK